MQAGSLHYSHHVRAPPNFDAREDRVLVVALAWALPVFSIEYYALRQLVAVAE
jgi:hypothetical protein